MNETINLDIFIENPDNPYKATDAELARLKGKLERVPKGLRAMRLAYVTDFIARDGTSYAGKCVVISGNKRLRELKAIYGDNAEVPAEWFADVTDMTAAERHEFIVSANTVDGTPDIDKLLEQYAQDELVELMGDEACAELLRSVSEASAEEQKQQTPPLSPTQTAPTAPSTAAATPASGDQDPPINPSTGFTYKEQYGVIVLCKDEPTQEQVYNKLRAEGYDCRVVAT